jgi:hypothetical protein
MNENPAPLPLPCQTILFRAIPYPELIKRGEHRSKIFFRRENGDPHGISLFVSIEQCRAEFGNPIYGVRSVHVGKLLDLQAGLGVFPDADRADHFNIKYRNGELTPRLIDHAPTCRNLGDDLMTVSRPVDYWSDPDADERFNRELEEKRAARELAPDNPQPEQ